MIKLQPSMVFLLAFLCAVATFGCGGDQSKQEFDTDYYMNAWLNLWNTYDLALVDELFLVDSSVTYFSSEREGLITGIDAVRSHHEGFGFVFGGRPAEQDLWVENVHTTTLWPAAIVTGVWLFGDREGAPEEAQRGPFTFVYVQRGDSYRLAHLNFGTYLETSEEEEG
jgi:hypothetical protein